MSEAPVATKAETKEERQTTDRRLFGFWVYLMTDTVLFASLFATYAVLHNNTFGGPPGSMLFSLPYVLVETLVLLTSSFTVGLSLLAAQLGHKKQALWGFVVTFALGVVFLGMELSEFRHFMAMGDSWARSGFLSAYFTLVGTHGLHITAGLIWMAVMVWRTVRTGLNANTMRRLTMLSLFWHFLDIIWIFIFTIVYMLGVM